MMRPLNPSSLVTLPAAAAVTLLALLPPVRLLLRVRMLFGVTLVALPGAVAAGAEEFGCAGPFGRDASHAGLIAAFGAANVRTEAALVHGETQPMTIVFPGDPDRRLMVHWVDGDGLKTLGFVIIQSPGWSVHGLAIGMPIAEVERVNGHPFKVTEFRGSDHDGEVRSWQGGRLEAALPGGCRVGAVLGINDVDVDTTRWPSHPDGLSSDDAALRGADPRLYELTVYFPDGAAR
jgi:hypothetical protein